MSRGFQTLSLLALLSLGAGAAAAQPSPAMSTVAPADALNGVVVAGVNPAPLPATILTITVNDAAGMPIPFIPVRIFLNAPTTLWCPQVGGGPIIGMTDGAGVMVTKMPAGGCAPNFAGACTIWAAGVQIRSYHNVKSPDWDGAAADGIVNLPDLLAFAAEFNGLAPPKCHDYNNDGLCNLNDLVIFGAAFSRALKC